ncbi:hypothetical protein ACHAXS_011262 [Conticribra weissflogii]
MTPIITPSKVEDMAEEDVGGIVGGSAVAAGEGTVAEAEEDLEGVGGVDIGEEGVVTTHIRKTFRYEIESQLAFSIWICFRAFSNEC